MIIVTYINPNAKERIIDKTFKDINILNQSDSDKKDDKIYIFSKIHNELYITSYKMFLDNKFIGVGVKNFRNFCDDIKYKSRYSCDSHPHNTYLQILAEIGIIGFIFLICIIFIYCKYLFKHIFYKLKKKSFFNDFEVCILSGILIYLWPLIPTGNFFNNWLNIMMFLNLPLLIWSRNLTKSYK